MAHGSGKMIDYIDIIKWTVLVMVIIIGSKRVWDMVRQRANKKTKWEDFMED